MIEGNVIYNTGRVEAGYGEGIYIGSDKGVHKRFNPTVSFVTVRNNVIGPDVRAEGIDVREGTHDVSSKRSENLMASHHQITLSLTI